MPGRLFLTTPMDEIVRSLGSRAWPAKEVVARRNIAPGQNILVWKPDRDLEWMRWGLIPVGRVNARGRPVMETLINARSETVFEKSAFADVGRCLVPADGWYEWTGTARRKTAWRLRLRSGGLIAFAGVFDIWKGPGGVTVPQVAIVTCPPNEDVRPIHHRMGVILSPDDFECWLTGAVPEAAALMRPLPEGLLDIAPAGEVNWSGP